MSRSVLVVGALVVVAAGVALVFALGNGDDTAHGSSSTPSTTATTSGSTMGQGPRPTLATGDMSGTAPSPAGMQGSTPGGPPPLATGPNAPVVTPRDTPRGQASADSPAGSSGSAGTAPSQNYVVGDVRVRDHRGGNQAPVDVPPNVHPAEGPRIDSQLTNAIGMKVRAIMFECAKPLPREGRGAQPRIEGQIVINVKANQASVLSAIIQPRDLPEATASALKSCTESKAVGQTAEAPNQADLDNYSINLAVRVP